MDTGLEHSFLIVVGKVSQQVHCKISLGARHHREDLAEERRKVACRDCGLTDDVGVTRLNYESKAPHVSVVRNAIRLDARSVELVENPVGCVVVRPPDHGG
jgi:hypothetical protein